MRLESPVLVRFRTLLSRAGAPVLLSLLAVFFAGIPAFSQGDTGRILGNVTDQSGGNIGGATVIITDVARGVKSSLITDADGTYVALGLLPGTYTVRVDSKGFKVFERQNILLEVGKDVRIDIVLQPGSMTEVITVTEAVPMVDTTTTTLGAPSAMKSSTTSR